MLVLFYVYIHEINPTNRWRFPAANRIKTFRTADDFQPRSCVVCVCVRSRSVSISLLYGRCGLMGTLAAVHLCAIRVTGNYIDHNSRVAALPADVCLRLTRARAWTLCELTQEVHLICSRNKCYCPPNTQNCSANVKRH